MALSMSKESELRAHKSFFGHEVADFILVLLGTHL